MIGIFIAIAILLGVGGTVTVADSARPGDALFGIDQAAENIRISLASDEKKDKLRIQFSEERIREIEDLSRDDDSIEDRTSRDDDKTVNDKNRSLTTEEQANINSGIELALNLLANLKAEQGENPQIDDIVNRLNAFITNLPSNARIEVSDDKLHIKFENEDEENGDEDSGKVEDKDDELKVELRTDEERIKIEVKNGVLEIKTKLDDGGDGDDDNSGSNSGSGN